MKAIKTLEPLTKTLPNTWKKLIKWTINQRKQLKEAKTEKEKIEIFKSNPILFGEFYIKPYTKNWNTKTAIHHYILIDNILRHKNNVTHVPVEHAKSTWITIVLAIWFVINDYDTQGAIISSTARQAEAFLSVIKWHIEYNPRLKRDFKKLKKGKKWTEKSIIVDRSIYNQSKDPTILTLGIGGEILGARLDWVILDDALSINNSTTKNWRDRLDKWFNQMVDGRVVDGGRRILVGTLQHNEDLLCKKSLKHYEIQQGISKETLNDDDFHYVQLKAYDKKTQTTLWPEKWPLKRILNTITRIGTIAFLKTLLNDRSARIGKMFSANWIKYWDKLPQWNFNIVIGFDPALIKLGQSPEDVENDECGLAVLMDDWANNKVYLLEEYAKHLTFNQQLSELKRFFFKYKALYPERVVTIVIESVYYQDALQQKLFADGLRAVGVNVYKDKVTRMEFLSADVETGRLLIGRDHYMFCKEFTDFEPNFSKSPNVLDATNTGMCYIKNKKEEKEEDADLLRNASLM